MNDKFGEAIEKILDNYEFKRLRCYVEARAELEAMREVIATGRALLDRIYPAYIFVGDNGCDEGTRPVVEHRRAIAACEATVRK